MSNDLGEVVGTLLAMAFGGIVLLKVAQELNSNGPINLEALGLLYLAGAIVGGIVLVYVIVWSLIR